MHRVVLTALLPFLVSLFSVWLIRTMAYRYGWVAQPRKDRWHKKPVALYGGVGMFVAFITANALLLSIDISRESFKPMCALLMGAGIVFCVGLIDDLRGLKPVNKLVFEIVAASIPILFGLVLDFTPWYLVNILATYFWFIGIVNAVNMLDNMDGLSSGIVMIATITILAMAGIFQANISDSLYLSVTLAFFLSTLGFWIFNRYPATIFMGDSGSLFLGYGLAFLAMPTYLNGYMGNSSPILALLLPVSILAVPIFDTSLVTIIRKFSGRPASQGGRDHSSHRLVGLGFSEQRAVNILFILGIIGGIIASLLARWPEYTTVFLVIYVILLVLFGVYLGKVKVYAEPINGNKRGHWTPIVSELLYKRHAGEMLLDITLVACSYYLAYLLRFEYTFKENFGYFTHSLPLVVASCLVSFLMFGIYAKIWEFISVRDSFIFLKSSIVGTVVAILLTTMIYRFDGYSRTVFVIFNILLFIFLMGSRLFFRLIDTFIDIFLERNRGNEGRRVLIYGAGEGGNALCQEVYRNSAYKKYKIVAFIDDDRNKHDCTNAGIKIMSTNFLKEWKGQIDEVWLSSEKINNNSVSNILEQLGGEIEVKRFILTLGKVYQSMADKL
jgi:UDP-GlcNAc:undecaprenyl-phosphate GlcNAc-1-phosphate transferase